MEVVAGLEITWNLLVTWTLGLDEGGLYQPLTAAQDWIFPGYAGCSGQFFRLGKFFVTAIQFRPLIFSGLTWMVYA